MRIWGLTLTRNDMHTRAIVRLITILYLVIMLSSCQPSAVPSGSAGRPMPTTAAPNKTFTNPLNSYEGADPWIQFYEGNYYLTVTQGDSIRMWKASSIAGLATAPATLLWKDAEPSRCCNVWAPEFHLLDGPDGKHWYLYYTAGSAGKSDNQRMHVLESAGSDPLGPYHYKARIFDPNTDGWAIDASVLTMPDGQLYLLFSSCLLYTSRCV